MIDVYIDDQAIRDQLAFNKNASALPRTLFDLSSANSYKMAMRDCNSTRDNVELQLKFFNSLI